MENIMIIQGRLTADPELKTTTSGANVTSFTLAVDRNTADKKTDFIPVVAWNKTAEFVCNYFGKGDMAIVEGSLQSRRWEDKNSEKRTAYECVANRVHFCGGKAKNESADVNTAADDDEEDLPF